MSFNIAARMLSGGEQKRDGGGGGGGGDNRDGNAEIKSPIEQWLSLSDLSNCVDTPEQIFHELEAAGLTGPIIQSLDDSTLLQIMKETKLTLKTMTSLLAQRSLMGNVLGDDLYTISASAMNGDGAKIWTTALLASFFFTVAPVASILIANENLDDDPDRSVQFQRSFTLGVSFFALLLVISPSLSMFFATDVNQERSFGTNHKQCMTTQMTNTAIVAALLATMVTKALQVDPPGGVEGAFLAQAYHVLLMISLYFAVSGVCLSVICMAYLQPVNGRASEKFLAFASLYFGEPLANICYVSLHTPNQLNLLILTRHSHRSLNSRLFYGWMRPASGYGVLSAPPLGASHCWSSGFFLFACKCRPLNYCPSFFWLFFSCVFFKICLATLQNGDCAVALGVGE